MDTKKQLDTTYGTTPSQVNGSLLLGLSGGVKSRIVAYLMSIQKYQLEAVSVNIGLIHRELGFDYPSLSEEEIKHIKSFCLKLGITHHLISAESEFEENVLNAAVSHFIEGKTANFHLMADQFILKKIYEKSLELNGIKIATGHLGKIISAKIYQNNLHEFDDSFYLGQCSKEILQNLILPLGDLKDTEIEKLRENFGIEASVKINSELSFSIEKYIPSGLPVSSVQSYETQKFLLNEVHLFSDQDLYEPFRATVITEDHRKFNAFITPRALNSLLIEFEAPQTFIVGEALSIMIPSGKNVKMIAQGKIKILKDMYSEEDSSVFKF